MYDLGTILAPGPQVPVIIGLTVAHVASVLPCLPGSQRPGAQAAGAISDRKGLFFMNGGGGPGEKRRARIGPCPAAKEL